VHVVIESEELFVKRRVVGEDACRVVVNLEAVGDGFDDDAGAGEVGNHPMKFGRWELRAETEITEVEFCEEGLGFGDASALAEEPGEKLELGDVILTVDVVVIDGVADEIEAGDAETFFVDGVIEERVVFGSSCCGGFGWVRGFCCGGFCWVGGEVGDADDGVVGVHGADFAEGEGEVAGDDDGVFAVGKLIVEVAAEIVVFRLIDSGGAHGFGFPVYVLVYAGFIVA